jgi:hypothetical protein
MFLTRAWIALLALSAVSTLLALGLQAGWGRLGLGLTASAILALAWAKARIIANRYLGLAAAPPLRQGFATVLAFYMLGLLALYLMG